jgi:hypothetical protein
VKQARTHLVSIRSIVASREFARGLNEVRNGLPFNADNGDWDYERGRHFGLIAPLDCRPSALVGQNELIA